MIKFGNYHRIHKDIPEAWQKAQLILSYKKGNKFKIVNYLQAKSLPMGLGTNLKTIKLLKKLQHYWIHIIKHVPLHLAFADYSNAFEYGHEEGNTLEIQKFTSASLVVNITYLWESKIPTRLVVRHWDTNSANFLFLPWNIFKMLKCRTRKWKNLDRR